MITPRVEAVRTTDPNGFALRRMGQTARAAADTYTLRQWAARLATRAGPKDYAGQVHELTRGITKRWRYVMEGGEWIPGTPAAVLGQTLGAAYNRGPSCPTPERCNVEATRWNERGWGDCDDVSTLAAAGVLALGMRPLWRVARNDSAAHVSVTAITPRGEAVEIDPVGYPDHPPGWAARGPTIDVQWFDLDGNPHPDPVTFSEGTRMLTGSYLGSDLNLRSAAPHLAMVNPADVLGPRVIAVPGAIGRMFRAGRVVPGAIGVDQYGTRWRYAGDLDCWLPTRSAAGQAHAAMLGATTFRQRRARRRRKTLRKVGRFFRRVGRAIAKVAKPLLRLGAKAAAATVGIPPGVTDRLLSGDLELTSPAVRSRYMVLRRTNPIAALQLHAAMLAARRPRALGCTPEGVEGTMVQVQDPRWGTYHAVPVAALLGVEGIYDPAMAEIASVPTPGKWYRVRKGDTLLGIAGAAFKVGAGGTRLKRAQWIDASEANAFALVPTKPGTFEAKNFGPKIVALLPKWSSDPAEQQEGKRGGSYPVLWIPPAQGVEPPRRTEPAPSPLPPPEPQPTPEPEPEPPVPECPPGMVKAADGSCVPFVTPPPDLPPVVEEPEEPEEPEGPIVEPEPKGEEPDGPIVIEPSGPPRPPLPKPSDPFPCSPWETRDPDSGRCIPITPPVPPAPSGDCPPGYKFDPYSRTCISVDPFPMPTPAPAPSPTPHAPPVYPPHEPSGGGNLLPLALIGALVYL